MARVMVIFLFGRVDVKDGYSITCVPFLIASWIHKSNQYHVVLCWHRENLRFQVDTATTLPETSIVFSPKVGYVSSLEGSNDAGEKALVSWVLLKNRLDQSPNSRIGRQLLEDMWILGIHYRVVKGGGSKGRGFPNVP